ncbi:sensor histidine kinase [Chitinophaga pinensis]|uniref:histidine kinase n=1 Tax=Chitinophaga pinensis TaxID=79329 RepID=A0A5C6LSE5_9BACT|nr:HAMP domain-containing sensor histidine kinase [Chitinophaga pinensis]TWW00181.1 HAMP domain-containing histidine kinase [Chitinophaga pinensis]
MNSTNSSGSDTLLSNASNVIAITAHEFKTPLATINSIVDLLTSKLQADHLMDAFYQKNLSQISSEIFALNSMVDEMLTINNILNGNIQSNKEMMDIGSLLPSLKEQYRAFPDDGRSLVIHITGTPREIFASPAQLLRIFSNLISNAFKYSRNNDPLMHLDYQDKTVVVTITDDGIGIPEADLPQLFQPYFRGSNTDGISGTGLGLSIVRSFITANEGTITVNSQPDKGTVFTVTFRYPDTCQ